LTVVLFFVGCSSPSQDASVESEIQRDTLSQYADGSPKVVTLSRRDSVFERRTYRRTGRLSTLESGDSVQTYFDLHDPDSAAVLRDYLQGRWQNLSADTSRDQTSAFYVFEADRLTFENPSRRPLESLDVTYENDRTVVTENGMRVQAEITSFDTVRVTGYTLVRRPASDSP
jgi:hypothetical protein